MPRIDLSDSLIHWTKGEDYQSAFDVLLAIIYENRLLAGCGDIKGQYYCVCFTETPKDVFHLVKGKYKPFGICIPKDHVYSLGGRPVIYQSNEEYDQLPDVLKWRHMRYEPHNSIDFTWEREWRARIDEVELDPDYVRIIVPDDTWVEALHQVYFDWERNRIWADQVGYGDFAGLQEPRPFPFECEVIRDV